MSSATERREQLKSVWAEASECVACPLHATRTTVVFGAGNADADLMFIGEAPGANEDRMGLPFVGQAGKLLDQLLGEIRWTGKMCSSPTVSSVAHQAIATLSRMSSPRARATCSSKLSSSSRW